MDRPMHPYPGSSHPGSTQPHYDGGMAPPSTSSTAPMIPGQDDDEDRNTENNFKLTPHVPIAFDDTFKESSAIKGFSFMKNVNGAIYKYTHFVLYATLTLIIGPILTFVWALFFAITHIFIIWLVQPSIKFLYVWMRIFSLLVAPFIRLFLDPLYKSMSLMLSSIKGQFRMNKSDLTLNVKTTQV